MVSSHASALAAAAKGVRTLTTANPLPATFLRGGTSKGIFLRRSDLPADPAEWTSIFQGIMGSPDPEYRRQLNGMGGGVSSLSKICVVGPPSNAERAAEVDVEYTFVQVGIDDGELDLSGNCGNLSSMIGVFALDEGLCAPRKVPGGDSLATVRSYNTNTNKIIDTTFPVSTSDGKPVPVLDIPQVEMAGVPGEASRILLQFVNPGGARTGKLLPTGNPVDILECNLGESEGFEIPASLVDATNPTVFISADDLAPILPSVSKSDIDGTLERIRQAGAEKMGLDPRAKAQPKIAVLLDPTGDAKDAGDAQNPADIAIHAYSMGVRHLAVPMTVGLCLGVAAGIENTVAHGIVSATRANRQVALKDPSMVRVRHPSGVVEVGAHFAPDGTVLSAQVVRTGRRLMKGAVWW